MPCGAGNPSGGNPSFRMIAPPLRPVNVRGIERVSHCLVSGRCAGGARRCRQSGLSDRMTNGGPLCGGILWLITVGHRRARSYALCAGQLRLVVVIRQRCTSGDPLGTGVLGLIVIGNRGADGRALCARILGLVAISRCGAGCRSLRARVLRLIAICCRGAGGCASAPVACGVWFLFTALAAAAPWAPWAGLSYSFLLWSQQRPLVHQWVGSSYSFQSCSRLPFR